VTVPSLFAIISELCPNRQVAGGGLSGRAGSGGPETAGALAATTRAPDTTATPEPGIAVAAQVSLAVAAKASAENFPVALRILPRRYRVNLTALYGFARLVDDIGDEPLPGLPGDTGNSGDPGDETITKTRLTLLDELDREVQRLYDDDPADQPQLDAIRALKPAVDECRVPAEPLRNLIQANRQDQLVTRYDSYAELEQYCTLSANPVGQVVLCIMDAATPERIAASDSICTALQIIEHCQDVAEDLANDRIYLPKQDMDAHHVTEDDLARPQADQNVRNLIKFEVDRAQRLLDSGSPLVGTLHGMARVAIAGYVAGGRATIKALRDSGHDVLRSTPKPGKADTVRLMARCYVKGR
jgi:squalene synthase HpnC